MKRYILALFLFSCVTINAQQLNKHNWKNRILVLVSNDKATIASNVLINEIEQDTIGLKERKLIIYKVLPKCYIINVKRRNSEELYNSLNPEKDNFKFILIGLDGRIKIEKNESLSKQELYAIIDCMPMRASELKSKQ